MKTLVVLMLVATIPPNSSESVLLSPQRDGFLLTEYFEGDLAKWIGQSGGAHSGMIVPDPLNPNNHVLTFSSLADVGDMFSFELPSYERHLYWLSFDYLGLPNEGTPEGNTGGKIGITNGSPGLTALWLAATIEEPYGVELIDNGQWHSYSTPFAPEFIPGIANGNFRIMIEDWCGRPPDLPQGVSSDAFYDNIELFEHHVPTKDTSWGAIKGMYR